MKNTDFGYPWEQERFDNLFNRDDRFFSLVTKGVLAWFNKNIILYNKPIKHFIFNTGSGYMYLEKDGYKYSMTDVTDQDVLYMERPRCVVELDSIEINTEELTQPNIRGVYERTSKTKVQGFNAELRRMPLTITFGMHYVLSNFNESIVLTQELIHKIVFQKYFKIVYLGQVVNCSIEIPPQFKIELNKVDMTSTDPNNRNIDFTINVCTVYPSIVDESESPNDKVISSFEYNMNTTNKDLEKGILDKIKKVSE